MVEFPREAIARRRWAACRGACTTTRPVPRFPRPGSRPPTTWPNPPTG